MSWISNIVDTVKKVVEIAQKAKLQADIAAAQGAVKTATQNYRNNSTNTNKKVLIDAINNYLTLAAYDLRKVAVADPSAIDAEIARLKADYNGTQREKDLLFPLLDELGTQIKNETPKQRDLQIQIHEARGDVQQAQGDVEGAKNYLDGFGTGPTSNPTMADARGAAADDLEKKQGAYSAAVAKLLSLEIELELTNKQPAGPNGTYSAEQWTQAGNTVKQRYGATGEFAVFIDQLATSKGGAQEIRVWLDKITKDPGSLNLTPAERDLAGKDPVSLAFLKANGITLDPNDPTLSPEMKTIAEQDPVLFAFLKLSNAKIWTDAKPPEGVEPLPLKDGKYLYITIGDGKPLPVTADMARLFDVSGPTALATTLIPQLGLDKNPAFGRLAVGADLVRSEYVDTEMKRLMGGANPDVKAAIELLGRNQPQFFSPQARAATWETSGRPYLEPVFKNEMEQFKFDGDHHMPVPLTSMATYMNERLKGAPPEVAALMLDQVMGRLDVLGRQAAEGGYSILGGDNSVIWEALSSAVELADQLPGYAPTAQAPGHYSSKVAKWAYNQDDLSMVRGATPGIAWSDIQKTGNTYLWDAMLLEAQTRSDTKASGFDSEFKYAVENGKAERGADIEARLNKQAYLNFLKNPNEILEPYFDRFLGDPYIGQEVKITNDTVLRNIIGKSLGLTPKNTEAAKNLDYTTEWYAPGTIEWNVIMTNFDLIKEEGGDDPTLKALPIKYVSEQHGVNSGALFVITKADGDEVVIDGTAAMSAVAGNGGAQVAPGDMHASWKFDDFKTFQEDNYYSDEGTLYVPTDFTLKDADGDGHADYQDKVAAITTGEERLKMGVSLAGAVLIFVPGAQGLGVTLLLTGAAMSIDQLLTMKDQGQSLSWSNPAAKAEYMNLIGSTAVFTRIGLIKWAANVNQTGKFHTVLDVSQKMAGLTATYVGFNQSITQGHYLATNWGSLSWGQRAHGMVMVAAGIAQMGFGSKVLNPRLVFKFKLDPVGAPRGASWRMNQLINQRATLLWETAGRPAGGHAAFRDRAFQDIKTEAINKRADELWQAAGSPPGPKNPYVTQATLEFNTSVGNRTNTLWQESGQPAGKEADYRDTAEYAVFEGAVVGPMSVPQRFRTWATNLGPRGREYVNDFRTEWAGRHGGNTPWTLRDSVNKVRADWTTRRASTTPRQDWKDFLHPLRNTVGPVKTMFKYTGAGYLIVNGGAIVLEAINYFGFQERRVDSAPTLTPQNAEAEMQKFLANPDQYLHENYENAFLGISVGDWNYNINGHLLSFTKPDGTQVYFRRVPESLYSAYKEAMQAKGQPVDGGLTIKETIKLDDTPGFEPDNAAPLGSHVTRAEAMYAAQIGEQSYQLWVNSGRPMTNATATYWKQVEAAFDKANGEAAYDVWVNAGRPTGGADGIWDQALNDMQGQIDAKARQFWQADGGTGSGPTQEHVDKAERELKGDIGSKAYDLWVKAGSQPNGAAGQHWTTAQQTFETDRAAPAFNAWVAANRPGGNDNVTWTTSYDNVKTEIGEEATKLWKQEGRPYEITVELREPWRENPTEDAFVNTDWDTAGWGDGALGLPGFRWRPSAAIGPVEGWRPRVDAEINFNYRYNQPNVTTVRAGLPSPTQEWGVGIRQQDTTIWYQLRVNAGAANYNKMRVYDLTHNNPGEEWAFMDGRAYLAFGNRNRVRVDAVGTNKGAAATGQHSKSYARIRETGFMELGLGMDFFKYAYGDENFSFNGYYELQLYAPDFRGQVNFRGDGAYTRGMQDVPPFFEIDPALQLSWTEPPRIAELPVLSGEER